MSRRNLKQEHRRNKQHSLQDQLHLHKTTRNLVRPWPPQAYNAHGVACSYHSKRAAHVAFTNG